MIPAPFAYHSPASLEEALDLLASEKDAKLLAGGQSLAPLMKLRLVRPKCLIDLSRIPGMNSIRKEQDRIVIGAMTTHADVENSALLKQKCFLLPQTATTIGDVQVRNRGTIGGSLAHADAASDMPAAVIALGAEIKAVSPGGERWIKAGDFFLGFLTTALEPDEILTEVKVPVLVGTKTAYLKAGQRASGFAVVGVAICLKLDRDRVCNDIAIGITGVTDKAYRPVVVEQKLKGNRLEPELVKEAAAVVTDGVDVIEDINGSKEYRSHLARVYTARAIQEALRSRLSAFL